MRMYRRSRCGVLLVLVVLAYVFLVLSSSENDSSLGFDPVSIKLALNKLMMRKDRDDKFQTAVEEKAQYLLWEEGDRAENEHLRFLMEMSNSEEANTLTLPPYITDPSNNENPHLQRFDPRFTFGFVLRHISRNLEKGVPLDDIEIPYFHWADWMDLSALDKHLLSKEKASCSSKFNVATESLFKNKKLELYDTTDYCIDDDKIHEVLNSKDTDPEFKKYLEIVKDNPYSPGWHVFGYSGRQKADARILLSRSYLNDFMPPPVSVLFLLPDETNPFFKTPIDIKVNSDIPSGRKKLIDTDAYSEFQQTQSSNDEDDTEKQNSGTINVLEEMSTLSFWVSKTQKRKAIQPTYLKQMQHSQFVDKSEDILKNLSSKKELSKRELVYKESLEYSIATRSPPKYFYEAKLLSSELHSGLGGHYDWRFFNGIVNFSDHQSNVLYGLVKAWFSFTNANNITSWVAHGSLLSWYWNGYAFPWDNDIDVQVPMEELHKLSRDYNQSIIVDLGAENNDELRYGRYFLDCGSFINYRIRGNGNNNIDARFIDLDTGLYIDITGLALSPTRTPPRYRNLIQEDLKIPGNEAAVKFITRNSHLQAYNCRNNHFARLSELSPLKLTFVEGQPAYIPNDFEQILLNEYNVKGISTERFKTYTFLPKLRIWVQDKLIRSFLRAKRRASNTNNKFPVRELTNEDYLNLFEQQKKILVEYMVTRKITAFHEVEIDRLSKQLTTKDLFFDSAGNFIAEPVNLRHDFYNFFSKVEGITFDNEIQKILDLVKIYDNPDSPLGEPVEKAISQSPDSDDVSQPENREDAPGPSNEPTNPPPRDPDLDSDKNMPVLVTQTDEDLKDTSKNRPTQPDD